MPIFGYGEDALTLWALTHRLDCVLGELEDDTASAAAVVLFRPSFGRRGVSLLWTEGDPRSAQFGEFDAIVATPKTVALLEAKRPGASEVQGDVVRLREEQVRRHDVMRWYIGNWQETDSAQWPRFCASTQNQFEKRFPGSCLPAPTTRLAKNLEYILRILGRRDAKVIDVVLFLPAPGNPRPGKVDPGRFQLITLECDVLEGPGFVELKVIGGPSAPRIGGNTG